MVSHEADFSVLPRSGSLYFGFRRRRKGSRHHNYGFIAHFVPSGASANSLLLLLLLISIPCALPVLLVRWFNLFLLGGEGVSTAIARIFMFMPPLPSWVRVGPGTGDCEAGVGGGFVAQYNTSGSRPIAFGDVGNSLDCFQRGAWPEGRFTLMQRRLFLHKCIG